MKDFLRRWSVIVFIIICLAGIFGPALLGGYPSDAVGAPFAKPLWWNGDLPVTRVFNIGVDGVSFENSHQPPEIFTLTGSVTVPEGGRAEIVWHTPVKNFILARFAESGKHWIDLDGRDMIFKQSLGLPLIGRSTDKLFPSRGRYSLEVKGASHAEMTLSLPGGRHGLLGTDQRGRDVFKLFIYGIRTSLTIGIAATAIACLLGLGLGLTAGYIGGMTDALIMRLIDILLSIPTLPILMVLAGIWGKGLWQLVLILSIFSWMGTARSVRSMVLSIRESPWIDGLTVLGAKRSYILFRHLVPETSPIMLANMALGVPSAILSEAGLAFLGLSDPRLISWGRMLHEAHSFGAFTVGAWWLLLPPGIGIAVICLVFMDMGRFLEEKIDPRLGGGDKNA